MRIVVINDLDAQKIYTVIKKLLHSEAVREQGVHTISPDTSVRVEPLYEILVHSIEEYNLDAVQKGVKCCNVFILTYSDIFTIHIY